jgi:hypothetical protein
LKNGGTGRFLVAEDGDVCRQEVVIFYEQFGNSVDIIQASIQVFYFTVLTYLAGCRIHIGEIVINAYAKHILRAFCRSLTVNAQMAKQ